MELEKRLIIEPFITIDDGRGASLHRRLIASAEKLPIGMTVSINTPLLSHGFSLIDELHDLGLEVLADLRLDTNDPTVCDNTAKLLVHHETEIVTVSANLSRPMKSEIKEILARKQIWTNLVGDPHQVSDFQIALEHQLSGHISEEGVWREEWQKAARKKHQPKFQFVAKCHSNGALTPKWAMKHGCDRIIMVVSEEDLEREGFNLIVRLQDEMAEGLMIEETVPDCPCPA